MAVRYGELLDTCINQNLYIEDGYGELKNKLKYVLLNRKKMNIIYYM